MKQYKNVDVCKAVQSKIDKKIADRFQFCPNVYMGSSLGAHSTSEEDLAVVIFYNKDAPVTSLSILKLAALDVPSMGVEVRFEPSGKAIAYTDNQPCA